MSIDKAVDEYGIFTWSELLLWSVWPVPILNTLSSSNLIPATVSGSLWIGPSLLTVAHIGQAHFTLCLLFPLLKQFPLEHSSLISFILYWTSFSSETFPSHLIKMPNLPLLDISYLHSLFILSAFGILLKILLYYLSYIVHCDFSVMWALQGKAFWSLWFACESGLSDKLPGS